MMRILTTCATVFLALALPACVYVPVVDEHKAASTDCKTYTRVMSIESIELHHVPVNDISPACNGPECLAAILATATVVTAGSAIISGSIVLAGNTVHWLEYQGTCSDGYLNKAKQLFLDSINKLKPTAANNPPK